VVVVMLAMVLLAVNREGRRMSLTDAAAESAAI
jgi:hypothetical protein